MMQRAPRIFAAGAAHIDRRGRADAPFRLNASNPGVLREAVGGSVFNAGLVLAERGATVRLLSGRGGDLDGQTVCAALATAGIDDLALTWLDRRTPSYTAILDDRGDLVAGIADMSLYDLLGARVLSRRHLREAMAACDALILDANLPVSGISRLLRTFAGRPIAAIGVSPAKAIKLGGELARISMLYLSRAEATAILGAADAPPVEMLARRLGEAGAGRAVVTDGPHPTAILDDGAVVLQAPIAVERLRDVTGAGDTLAAVATLAAIGGQDFTSAVRLGMAAATARIAMVEAPSQSPSRTDPSHTAGAMPPPVAAPAA